MNMPDDHVPCAMPKSRVDEYASGNQHQSALLLRGVKEPYVLVTDHAIPCLDDPDEMLVKVAAIGLNPVDWKAPYVFDALHCWKRSEIYCSCC